MWPPVAPNSCSSTVPRALFSTRAPAPPRSSIRPPPDRSSVSTSLSAVASPPAAGMAYRAVFLATKSRPDCAQVLGEEEQPLPVRGLAYGADGLPTGVGRHDGLRLPSGGGDRVDAADEVAVAALVEGRGEVDGAAVGAEAGAVVVGCRGGELPGGRQQAASATRTAAGRSDSAAVAAAAARAFRARPAGATFGSASSGGTSTRNSCRGLSAV